MEDPMENATITFGSGFDSVRVRVRVALQGMRIAFAEPVAIEIIGTDTAARDKAEA